MTDSTAHPSTLRARVRPVLSAAIFFGALLSAPVFLTFGCSESHGGDDAGIVVPTDAATAADATTSPTDGAIVPADDASTGVDGGTVTPLDASVDAATATDGGGAPDAAALDAGMMTRAGAVGSACASDADCTEPSGGTCMTTIGSGGFSYEFPGGYCTAECTAGSGAAECGAGSDCFSVGFGGFGYSTCAKTCGTNADCRADDGYTCQAPPIGGGTTRYCLPPMGGGGSDGGFSFGDGGFVPPSP